MDLMPVENPFVALILVPRPGNEMVPCQVLHRAAANLALVGLLFDHVYILPRASATSSATVWIRSLL
jgi:hypothetical protein